MNTNRARSVLRCSAAILERLARDGQLRKEKRGNRIEWNDDDLARLAGFDYRTQITVVYARTESIGPNSVPSAEVRLEKQKQDLINYCKAKGWGPDLVIGDVRRVNRIRHVNGELCSGFSALMGLLAERRVKRLVIDTRDRISVGASWEMIDWILRTVLGIEVVVVNKVLATTESREESKFWIADMLQVHKALVGEIRDKKLLDQFMGGPDLGISAKALKRLDDRLKAQKIEDRTKTLAGTARSRAPIDLDELFA